MRVGYSWRDLPPAFGAQNAIYKCFRAWCESGKWLRIFKASVSDPDLEWAFMDDTYAKAHQHSADAVGLDPQAIGRSRAGLTIKPHKVVDASMVAHVKKQQALGRPINRGDGLRQAEKTAEFVLHIFSNTMTSRRPEIQVPRSSDKPGGVPENPTAGGL